MVLVYFSNFRSGVIAGQVYVTIGARGAGVVCRCTTISADGAAPRPWADHLSFSSISSIECVCGVVGVSVVLVCGTLMLLRPGLVLYEVHFYSQLPHQASAVGTTTKVKKSNKISKFSKKNSKIYSDMSNKKFLDR